MKSHEDRDYEILQIQKLLIRKARALGRKLSKMSVEEIEDTGIHPNNVQCYADLAMHKIKDIQIIFRTT